MTEQKVCNFSFIHLLYNLYFQTHWFFKIWSYEHTPHIQSFEPSINILKIKKLIDKRNQHSVFFWASFLLSLYLKKLIQQLFYLILFIIVFLLFFWCFVFVLFLVQKNFVLFKQKIQMENSNPQFIIKFIVK